MDIEVTRKMNVKENNVKNYVVSFLVMLFIICSVASYTQIGSTMKIIKNIIQVLIILVTISDMRLRKYRWIYPLLLIFIIYPLLLVCFGIYNLYPFQVILYVGTLLFNIIFYMGLTEHFFNRFNNFIALWQNSLFIVLMLLLIIYRGISLNIPYMLRSVITNDRYGSDLLVQRYGMGFNNVNQLALFASLLFICSLYFMQKRQRMVFSGINLILSFILICNSESRAPFVAIGVALLMMIASNINSKFLSTLLKNCILFCLIFFGIFFCYYSFKGSELSSIYYKLNTISSMRLYFSSEALSLVELSGTKWFGIGPISTSFVTNKVFGNILTLDSSLGYSLFAFGIIGTVVIFSIIIYMILKNYKNESIFLVIFFVTYSMFENAIFIPNSLLSCFGCVILFIFMRRKNGY